MKLLNLSKKLKELQKQDKEKYEKECVCHQCGEDFNACNCYEN